MVKSLSDNPAAVELARILEEKKKMLLGQTVAPDGGINIKKLSREEKEKIKKAIKKKKKKLKKQAGDDHDSDAEEDEIKYNAVPKPEIEPGVEVEYVEKDEFLLTGKYYDEFKHIFQMFATAGQPVANNKENQENKEGNKGDDEIKEEEKPLSKKKLKQMKRLRVAELKAIVKRPDVVEVWDCTARDPVLLVYLKSYKNSVQVPRHWSQKRKFLQNKRGILKPPFKLPDNVENTGIAKLRDPFNDKEAGRLVRQKLRERMNPKLGKIDIDYEILHDAFFKYQSKSKMTYHGDIYFEGKEDEVKMRQYKPGKLSEDLRQALGISEFAPPPWLINMQRYGPPPSYPHLKIPGLNAPMPDGSSFGYFYNKGAYDEQGKPLFSTALYHALRGNRFNDDSSNIDKSLWGELQESEPQDQYENQTYNDTMEPRTDSEIKSGISSIISGIETPEIELQKRPAVSKITPQINPHDTVPKPLYQVLEPVQKSVGSGIYGTSVGYIIPGVNDKEKK